MTEQQVLTILQRHLPPAAAPYCLQLWKEKPFTLKIVKSRLTKIGDFTSKGHATRPQITLNGDLNPYSFLITYIHEVAHLFVFLKFSRHAEPHGEHWKYAFRRLMAPMLKPDIFPEEVLNKGLFLTWWSPGQYAVPGVVSQLLGISTGTASIWVTLLFSIVGLVGWYFVYRELGFDELVIGLCLFLIATSRLFTINFLNYTGGELLLFGSQSWTIWYYLKYRSAPLKLFVGLLLLSLVSFFLKSAYTIGFAALGGCAGLAFVADLAKTRKLLTPSFITVVVIGLCIVCYLGITQFGFVALGTSPITSTSQPFKMVWASFETLTYPLTHWFSIAEIYPRLLQRTSFPLWGHGLYYVLLLVGFVAMIRITLETRRVAARAVFVGFYVVYCGVFLLLYNKGADISIEYRHTKVVAYLFLPLLVAALQQPIATSYRAGVLWLLLILNTGYGLSTFV